MSVDTLVKCRCHSSKAVAGTSNPLASVWILDKRAVTEASRGSARVAEAFLQLCRKDAANLAKLKHPNVVRLLEPFEETRSQLLMVTEAVTASVADVLQLRKASSAGSSGAGSLQLSELEIKHGFLQVRLPAPNAHAHLVSSSHTSANVRSAALQSGPHVFSTVDLTWYQFPIISAR